MRLIYPTEERALTWAKRAATWQKRLMYVVKLGSKRFEVVKERPLGAYLEVTPLQEVLKWESGLKIETNGGLNQ